MKMSFLPGDLHLTEDAGQYLVSMQGQEVFRTRSRRAAIERFAGLRQQMELRFPKREITADEKAEILGEAIADSLVGHNSLGGRKKKSTAGGTRTFGG